MRFWDASAIVPWPATLEVITLDERLATAARKEGFVLVEVPSTE
jgi:hypothetical protein